MKFVAIQGRANAIHDLDSAQSAGFAGSAVPSIFILKARNMLLHSVGRFPKFRALLANCSV
jgi:hypothetical protein